MLEAQALQDVVQLDVDAQIVGVELQAVARAETAIFLYIQGDTGRGAIMGDLPVLVAVCIPFKSQDIFERRHDFLHAFMHYNALSCRRKHYFACALTIASSSAN